MIYQFLVGVNGCLPLACNLMFSHKGSCNSIKNRLRLHANIVILVLSRYFQRTSNNASDYTELTRIALSQTLRYVGDAFVFMKKSERNETDYYLKDLYSRCGKDYNLVLKRFEHGILAFSMGDVKRMVREIENCGGLVEECEIVMGDVVSEVHEKNLHARVLVRMSVVSGGLIH